MPRLLLLNPLELARQTRDPLTINAQDHLIPTHSRMLLAGILNNQTSLDSPPIPVEALVMAEAITTKAERLLGQDRDAEVRISQRQDRLHQLPTEPPLILPQVPDQKVTGTLLRHILPPVVEEPQSLRRPAHGHWERPLVRGVWAK